MNKALKTIRGLFLIIVGVVVLLPNLIAFCYYSGEKFIRGIINILKGDDTNDKS